MAAAQGLDPREPLRLPVEVSPSVSTGSSGAPGIGAAVRWSVAPKLGVELESEVRWAELTAVNTHAGLVYDLLTIGRVTPYVAGGVGLERFGHAIVVPGMPVLTGTGTTLATNAGGGVRVPVTDRFGVRLDARWFNPHDRRASERWRVSTGVTLGFGRR
jgi:opacity protein-like surface antigen